MHSTLRTTLLACAASAGTGLIWLADAQDVVEGGIALLHGSADEGPWGEAKSDFDALLRSPNATGSFPITGPGTEYASTDSNETVDWSWSISVVADLPIPRSSEDGNKSYTGGNLVFNGPFSAGNMSSTSNDTADDGWSVCLYDWSLWGAAYPAPLRADNGTCLSVLSPGCKAAIERAASSAHTSRGCSCPAASGLPECAGDDSALWSTTCGAAWYDAPAVRAWGPGGLEKMTFGDARGHERGNTTAYDYVGSLAWPVMASFRNSRTGAAVAAQMSCPRADVAAEGSTAPTADGLGGQGGQQGDGGDGGQGDQEGRAARNDAGWLVLGGLLVATMLIV